MLFKYIIGLNFNFLKERFYTFSRKLTFHGICSHQSQHSNKCMCTCTHHPTFDPGCITGHCTDSPLQKLEIIFFFILEKQ